MGRWLLVLVVLLPPAAHYYAIVIRSLWSWWRTGDASEWRSDKFARAWVCRACGANDFEDHRPGCKNDPANEPGKA